jgi:hypothetical protein
VAGGAVGWQIYGSRVHDDVKLSLSEGKEGPSCVECGYLKVGFSSLPSTKFRHVLKRYLKITLCICFFFFSPPVLFLHQVQSQFLRLYKDPSEATLWQPVTLDLDLTLDPKWSISCM